MKILAIDHLQLAMPAGGEGQAREFYAGILGFIEKPKPTGLAKRGGAWFECGSVQIHLGVDADFHPARKAHPAFIIDDLNGFMARLRESGYEVDTSQPLLDGYERAHVFDPFGNRIELMQRIA